MATITPIRPIPAPAVTHIHVAIDVAMTLHDLITPEKMLKRIEEAVKEAVTDQRLRIGSPSEGAPHVTRMVKIEVKADVVSGEPSALAPQDGNDVGGDFKLLTRPFEKRFIIVGPTLYGDDALYWNNNDGWGDRADATTFFEAERNSINMPAEAVGTEDATPAGGEARCWIEAGNVAISIKRESEGVVVDMFPKGGASDSLATMAVFYEDAESAFMDENQINDDIDVATRWIDAHYPDANFDKASPEDRLMYLTYFLQRADSDQPDASRP